MIKQVVNMKIEDQSINFDGSVNFTHKRMSPDVTNSTTHDSKSNAEQRHVSKIKRCLEKSIHSENISTCISRFRIFVQNYLSSIHILI